jgi:hypothetical protein
MGERSEEMAYALVAQLRAAGVDGRVSGGGIEWHVDAGVDRSRACACAASGTEQAPHARRG